MIVKLQVYKPRFAITFTFLFLFYLLIILGTSVSKKFREGDLHLTTSLVFNPLNPEMPPEEEAEWVHEVLSPTLYELGIYNY